MGKKNYFGEKVLLKPLESILFFFFSEMPSGILRLIHTVQHSRQLVLVYDLYMDSVAMLHVRKIR